MACRPRRQLPRVDDLWQAALVIDPGTAVAEREHWRTWGTAAVYSPPGSSAMVRVQAMLQPTGRERFRTAIIRHGRAEHTVSAYSAQEAVVL